LEEHYQMLKSRERFVFFAEPVLCKRKG